MAPAGYLDLRAAARRIGPHVVPGWRESDEFAPRAGEDSQELHSIAEMTDRQLKDAARSWRRRIEQEAARERTAREAAGAPASGRKEAAEKLRAQIAVTADRKTRGRLRKLLTSLEEPADAVQRVRRGRGEELRRHVRS